LNNQLRGPFAIIVTRETPLERFRNVLLVADEASASEAVLSRARWLAEANGAALTIVDVIDAAPGELSRLFSALPGARGREVEAQVIETHRARLDAIAQPFRAAGLAVETRVLQGVAFIETIRHVQAHGNDLVLKGAERAPDRRVLRGPDLHLLRKCPCPVWILDSTAEAKARRIMAAVDPDPDDAVRDGLNRMVMELATSLARRDGASLDVVNAWYLPEESVLRHGLVRMPAEDLNVLIDSTERASARRLHALTGAFGEFDDLMRVLHIKGNPADVISEHAEGEQIDTLVMGTLARTGIAGMFIGNTAETVLNRVGCSLLTVKPEGFVSPVTAEPEGTA
jgi:universal stress protein E